MKGTISLFLIGLTTFINAQVQLTGKVLNDFTGEPIEYAEVRLEDEDTGELRYEIFTDENGKFLLEVQPDKYFINIEAIGLGVWQQSIDVQKSLSLNNVRIRANEVELEGVEVEADKPLYRYELDKKVYDVSRDITARGANLTDVLQNVPSVSVDIDGTVSLRGSSNVRFLINGKPSGLLGISDPNEALRQFSADQVERVEIITNPSARYEAEGTAGIINIVLKKGKGNGFNGSVETFVGYFPNYGGNLNLNWKKNKIGWFLNAGYQYESPEATRSFDLRSTDPITGLDSMSLQNALRIRQGNRYNASLGGTYDWNQKNSLGTTFSFRVSNYGNSNDINYEDYRADGSIALLSSRNEFEDEKDDSFQWDLTYDHVFDVEKDERFSFSSSIQRSSEEEFARISEDSSFPAVANLANDETQNLEDQYRVIVRLDYINPFKEGANFEFGGQYSLNNIINDFFVQSQVDGQVIQNAEFTDVTEYDEHIYAAYAQYGNTFKKFSFQTGLRTEISDIAVLSEVNNSRVNKEYTSFFPSLFLNYNFSKDHQIQLNFARRISRPRSRFLIPFFTFADDRNTFRGNSDLNPAFTWLSELAWVKKIGKLQLTPTLFYRRTTDEFEIVVEEVEIEVGNEVQTTFVAMPVNVERNVNMGMELAFNWKPKRWWSMFGEFSVFRFDQKGEYQGQNLDGEGTTMQARWNHNFTLPGSLDFQLQFNYRGRTETNQNVRRGFYGINLGFSKDLFEERATLSLNVRDLFNSQRRIIITTGENFVREADLQWRARQINLSFIYRFNQKKRRSEGRRGEGGDRDIGF